MRKTHDRKTTTTIERRQLNEADRTVQRIKGVAHSHQTKRRAQAAQMQDRASCQHKRSSQGPNAPLPLVLAHDGTGLSLILRRPSTCAARLRNIIMEVVRFRSNDSRRERSQRVLRAETQAATSAAKAVAAASGSATNNTHVLRDGGHDTGRRRVVLVLRKTKTVSMTFSVRSILGRQSSTRTGSVHDVRGRWSQHGPRENQCDNNQTLNRNAERSATSLGQSLAAQPKRKRPAASQDPDKEQERSPERAP